LLKHRPQVAHACVFSNTGADIQFSEAVKLLDVTLDTSLSFDQQVTNVVRACNFHLRSMQHLRPSLTFKSAKSMATAIIGARIYYCNGLRYGTMEWNLNRLQKVQNSTARIVPQTSFQTSAMALCQQLHWLVRQRITYKLATLTFKAKYCRTRCIFLNSFETTRLPGHLDLLPLHCFTDHLCPPSSPLGHSSTLHLKFGTVSGHPQDR